MPVQISLRRGGDEEVILAWIELQAAGSGSKSPKCYGEIHQFVWLVTHSHHFRVGTDNSAVLVLLSGDAVYDVALYFCGISTLRVVGTNEICLVELVGLVVPVDVNDVICVVNAKHWIRRIPEDSKQFLGGRQSRRQHE